MEKMAKFEEIAQSLKVEVAPEKQRRVNTAAAAIGSLIGLGVTALSSRSNPISLGITAGCAAYGVYSIYKNKHIHEKIAVNNAGAVGLGLGRIAATMSVGGITNMVSGYFSKEIAETDVESES